MPVFVVLNIAEDYSKGELFRKYGSSCGSAAISAPVTPVIASVGTQCLPRANCVGKSHRSFWSSKTRMGKCFQEISGSLVAPGPVTFPGGVFGSLCGSGCGLPASVCGTPEPPAEPSLTAGASG